MLVPPAACRPSTKATAAATLSGLAATLAPADVDWKLRTASLKVTSENESIGRRPCSTPRSASFACVILAPLMLPEVSSTNTRSRGSTLLTAGVGSGVTSARKYPPSFAP